MSRLTLIYNINKRNYLLAIILLISGYALIGFQIYSLSKVETNDYIEPGYGYYQGFIDQADTKLKNFEIVNVPTFDADLEVYNLDNTSNDLATDLAAIDYEQVPDEIYSQNLASIQNGDYVETYHTQLSPYGPELANFHLPIDSIGANELYAGKYPTATNEIAVPFNIAYTIAADNKLAQYDDALNRELKFELNDQQVSKKIVGIVNSMNIIIADQSISKDIAKDGYIIKFSSIQDIKALEQSQNIDILTNEDLQADDMLFMYLLELLLMWMVWYVMLKDNYQRAVNYLQQISYQVRNKIVVICGIVVPVIFLTVGLAMYWIII